MENKRIVRWGDIYYCDLGDMRGSVQRGKRPVIVIQSNGLNKNSPTVTVAVITSVRKKQSMPSHINIGTECGLPEDSMIMLEQTRTVDKNEELLDYIGFVKDKEKREEIKRGIKIAHGIPVKSKGPKKALVMYLCPRCRERLMNDKSTIIRRVDHFDTEKNCCDRCGVGYGYEYLVLKREHTYKRSDD